MFISSIFVLSNQGNGFRLKQNKMTTTAKNLFESLLENGINCPVLINALCVKISVEFGYDKEEFVNELYKNI